MVPKKKELKKKSRLHFTLFFTSTNKRIIRDLCDSKFVQVDRTDIKTSPFGAACRPIRCGVSRLKFMG